MYEVASFVGLGWTVVERLMLITLTLTAAAQVSSSDRVHMFAANSELQSIRYTCCSMHLTG
jgi:hypothetical protein